MSLYHKDEVEFVYNGARWLAIRSNRKNTDKQVVLALKNGMQQTNLSEKIVQDLPLLVL